MKIHFLLGSLTALFASGLAAESNRISLKFENIEDYRDFSVEGMSEERTLPIFTSEVQRELDQFAVRYIEEGLQLEITFTDIDMAGDIQPWRNRNNADIRYIETIYPPRLHIKYQLMDASGGVIQEGEEKLSDLSFNLKAGFNIHQSTFFYEVELLKNWIRRSKFSGDKS